MQITRPSDCGKAPGIAIVGEFAAKWAAGEATAVAEWLTDDASWSLIGAGTHSGPEAAEQVLPRRMGFSHALRVRQHLEDREDRRGAQLLHRDRIRRGPVRVELRPGRMPGPPMIAPSRCPA